MARTTPRKDSLASFVWTMGAADMVIGGVGERGSLFAFGLVTVGAGVLVSWLRQRRLGGPPFSTRPQGASAFLAQRFRSQRFSPGPRARTGGRNSRAGLGTPNYGSASPARPPSYGSSTAQGIAQSSPAFGPVNSGVRPRPPRRSQTSAPFNQPLQGPPLNLPPAPRPRSRRGRRIY